MIVAIAACALLLSAALTFWVSSKGSPLFVLDHPNQRSLHARPVPRSGGVAIVLAMALTGAGAGLVPAVQHAAPGLLAGFLLVAGVSFIEDRWGVPVPVRLLVHLMAALLLVRGGLSLATLMIPGAAIEWPSWLATVATLLFVVWMANLYNFMDGIDGLAGGMAVLGFAAFAVLGYRAGDTAYMATSLIVTMAAAGFLLFNFPPARCFMGDTGASTLGYLVAAFALWGSYQFIIPIWISVLVFSPFVVDATVTLLRRVGRRERFWEPHHTHYYQRLIRVGWSHRRTALAEYALMTICALAAAVALQAPPSGRWAVLFTVAALYAVLMHCVARLERRRTVRYAEAPVPGARAAGPRPGASR
jgi:UDP-N-acetylmuramyl pentapeptide phosphotransferase/UDP-N-acetylglucosamine-1-phosphate transferase